MVSIRDAAGVCLCQASRSYDPRDRAAGAGLVTRQPAPIPSPLRLEGANSEGDADIVRCRARLA